MYLREGVNIDKAKKWRCVEWVFVRFIFIIIIIRPPPQKKKNTVFTNAEP